MRVLYFDQHFSTPAGSTGNRTYWFARRFVERGHRVTVVTGSYRGAASGLDNPFRAGRREGLVDGIRVVEYDMSYANAQGYLRRSWVFLRYAIRSAAVATTSPADVVVATSTPLTIGIPAIVARWLRRRPMVFEVRDLWPDLPREMGVITNRFVLGALSALEWMSYRSARRLIGLSPGIVDGIVRRGPDAADVALIPNGCDLVAADAVDRRMRPEGVTADALLCVYTGTHGLANGLDRVLDAAAELRRRGVDDIRIALVGQGGLKDELRSRAEREGLDAVLFLDPLPKAELFELLRGADVGIQSLANVPAFYYGTSPNKFFDYVSVGLPVLNNYPGWLAEMIVDHDCGFAVPPDDPVAFADALERAHRDRGELRRKGASARRLAEREFARDDLAERFVRWVEGAVR